MVPLLWLEIRDTARSRAVLMRVFMLVWCWMCSSQDCAAHVSVVASVPPSHVFREQSVHFPQPIRSVVHQVDDSAWTDADRYREHIRCGGGQRVAVVAAVAGTCKCVNGPGGVHHANPEI